MPIIHYGDEGFVQTSFEGAWDDLRFPAQALNPLGSASPPALDDTLSGFPGTLLFSGSAENVIAGVAQMPHSWARGTEIRPHIHWMKPVGSSDAVTWHLYYRQLGFPFAVAEDWVGPIVGEIAAGVQTVSDSHIISSFTAIDMTGRRESTMLCWRIHRMGNTDAESGTARLLEFDIHFLVEKTGTLTEIPSAS